MNFKKFIAIFTAITIILTLFSFPVNADAAKTILAKRSEGSELTARIVFEASAFTGNVKSVRTIVITVNIATNFLKFIIFSPI